MRSGRRYIKVTERRFNYFKMGQVTKMLRMTSRTIRYYEQMGLLPAARRTTGRMRLFSEGELKLLKRIRELQTKYNLPLRSIKKKLEEERANFLDSREKGRIKIVVDSTASLPLELIQEYGIEVIPMKVIFGKSVFEDGETMTALELRQFLETGRNSPRTSPPDYEEIMAVYNNIYERGAEKIISIHVSSKISDVVFAAKKAASYLSHFIQIEVLDSQCMAMGSGLLALEAAKMLRAGKSFEETVAQIKARIPLVREALMVDSLDYLARGKDVHVFLKLLLDFKPVFSTLGGKIHLLSRASNQNEVREIFMAMAEKSKNGMGIMYSEMKADADQLVATLQKKHQVPIIQAELSTVPSVYFGPKSLGIAVY